MLKKELFKNKKVLAAVIAAVVIVLASVGVAIGINANKGGKGNAQVTTNERETQKVETKKEPATITDLVAISLFDKDGNETVVEGVAVTNPDGSATVTVKDKNGNEMVVQGKAYRDESGKLQVSDPIVISGDKIVADNGNEISVSETTVGSIADNNKGEIATDISADDTTKADVADKKKEEEVTASNNNNSNSNTETNDNKVVADNGNSNADSGVAVNPGSPTPDPSPTPTPSPAPSPDPTPTPDPTPSPAPTPQPTEPETPAPQHGVTVGTAVKYIYWHDRDDSVAKIVPLTYHVDAYGDPTDDVTYEEEEWLPDDYTNNTEWSFEAFYINAHSGAMNRYWGRQKPLHINDYPGDIIHLYMKWHYE